MKKFLTRLLTISMVTTLIITQTACAGKTEKVEKDSYYMDTMCRISIYDMEDMSEEKAESAIDAAFALCAEYESLISVTREGSDIYKINHAKGAAVTCDPRTIEVIKKGIEYGELSDGKFDITIGQVTDLWDFHAEEPQLPSASKIKTALEAVDYHQIKIDGNTVTMANAAGEINLGGVGKGYVGDKAAELLQEKGVTSAVINLGGNIIAIGDHNGDDFKIGITKPFSERDELIGAMTVKDATVVTSGTYERSFEIDGKIYHHILDVNTGYPVDTDVVSVSLVSDLGRSGDCDAMSTICLILGVKEGVKFIEKVDGVEAVFVDQDGKITKTSGMDSFREE
ncbi:FAD:protein FMN transferase [Emergencia sp.]|uniref:FAD:protein FMN transferase n=1 Tax=Emergencia sp. TaxID=1926557 RepID=UPI003AF1535C